MPMVVRPRQHEAQHETCPRSRINAGLSTLFKLVCLKHFHTSDFNLTHTLFNLPEIIWVAIVLEHLGTTVTPTTNIHMEEKLMQGIYCGCNG